MSRTQYRFDPPPRRRIGALRDSDGNVQHADPNAPPHDWTSFDRAFGNRMAPRFVAPAAAPTATDRPPESVAQMIASVNNQSMKGPGGGTIAPVPVAAVTSAPRFAPGPMGSPTGRPTVMTPTGPQMEMRSASGPRSVGFTPDAITASGGGAQMLADVRARNDLMGTSPVVHDSKGDEMVGRGEQKGRVLGYDPRFDRRDAMIATKAGVELPPVMGKDGTRKSVVTSEGGRMRIGKYGWGYAGPPTKFAPPVATPVAKTEAKPAVVMNPPSNGVAGAAAGAALAMGAAKPKAATQPKIAAPTGATAPGSTGLFAPFSNVPRFAEIMGKGFGPRPVPPRGSANVQNDTLPYSDLPTRNRPVGFGLPKKKAHEAILSTTSG